MTSAILVVFRYTSWMIDRRRAIINKIAIRAMQSYLALFMLFMNVVFIDGTVRSIQHNLRGREGSCTLGWVSQRGAWSC